jgi:hypothetical protein
MFRKSTLVAALGAAADCKGHVMAISNHSSGAYGASGNPKASAGPGYFLGSSTHAEVAPYVAEYCTPGS